MRSRVIETRTIYQKKRGVVVSDPNSEARRDKSVENGARGLNHFVTEKQRDDDWPVDVRATTRK